MKFFLIIILTISAALIGIKSICQDSLYAKKIDSLWLKTYKTRELKNKRTKERNVSVQYTFYKRSGNMRSIVSLNGVIRENLIFFYIEDKLVMISPSGQQPYFVQNDKLVYAAQMQHTIEQIDSLIARSYNYLEQGYRKIKGTRD